MRASSFLLCSGVTLHLALALPAAPPAGSISGKVVLEGTAPKPKKIYMNKEPACAQSYSTPPTAENVVVGPGNALANVVVFITAGPVQNESASSIPVILDQKGCRYVPHVVALRAGQSLKVTNSDPVVHNVYVIAKENRESNQSQAPGAAPLLHTFGKPEFIPVKCNVHPWMRGTIAVLGTSHFAVTDASGGFTLPDLPPGKYTLTAWHEYLGEQTQEVTVTGAQTKAIQFTFKAKL